MASVIVLYTKPDDVEGFEAHYRDTHGGLARNVPELESFGASRIVGTPRGTEPAYYLKAELHFPSMEALGGAMQSQAMQAVSRDAMEMCRTYGTSAEILIAEAL